jgi:hypothetical protein
MKQFVVIATPSFERRPCIEYVISMLQTEKVLATRGIDHATTILGGDPYLSKVRNRLVSSFLQDWPLATDLFFIDDDIGWPEYKILEFLDRPEEIVVGVYPKKQDNLEFPVSLEVDENNQLIEQNGLFRAKLVPTGFMRIKRHVLERMAQRVGRYQEVVLGGKVCTFWNIFEARYVDHQTEELRRADLDSLSREEAVAYLKRVLQLTVPAELGQYWGEDYFFAERWREMGGHVWVDPDIEFTHRGSKDWKGNFIHSVRSAQSQAQSNMRSAA